MLSVSQSFTKASRRFASVSLASQALGQRCFASSLAVLTRIRHQYRPIVVASVRESRGKELPLTVTGYHLHQWCLLKHGLCKAMRLPYKVLTGNWVAAQQVAWQLGRRRNFLWQPGCRTFCMVAKTSTLLSSLAGSFSLIAVAIVLVASVVDLLVVAAVDVFSSVGLRVALTLLCAHP